PVRFLGKMTKPASDAPWVGNMAARFDDVSLGDIIQSIAATADFLPFQHSAGKVSGSITATYSHAEGIAIKATVDVVDAQIQPQFDATDTSDKSDSLLAFEHVRFDADISSRQFPSSGQEWEGHLSNVRIRHAGQTWPTKTVDIQIRSAPAPSSAVSGTTSGIPLPNTLSVSLLLDAFRVADLRRIASPYITRASVATLVSKTAATGLLRQVDANLTFSNGALEQFSLTGAVRALHTAPGFDIPGFSNIHGALNASLAGGQISIDSSDASILIPSLYDKPMHLGAAQGSVRWRFEPEGGVAMVDSVSLRSGKVGGRIDGQVRWAIGDEPPHIKATLEFDAAPYENLAPWLLVKDIPPAVLKWMAGAIRDANFDSVKVAVNASTDKLPFDAGPNGLTFKAKFHDAGLQYAEGWPLGNRLRGTFALAGPALSATLSGGDVLGTKLTSVTVGAPDLLASEPRVNVSGIFTGDSTHLMRYVRATPLRHGLGQELADLVISGPSKVDFSLTLVPSTGEVRALKGKVALTKNTLDSQRGLRFDDASGQLDFDRSGVTATALRATFLGAPVTLKSHLMPNAAREVALEGIADSAFLSALGRALQLLPSSANVDQPSGISPALFSGTAAWTAKLTLPSIRSTNSADTQGVTKPVISRLSVTSPLDGTRIALPGQFGKLAHTRRPLAVEVAFNSPTLRILTVRYGVDLRARVALMRPSDGLGTAWAIGRGHIRLGGSEAVLPTLPGLFITGQMANLNIDAWGRALANVTSRASSRVSPRVSQNAGADFKPSTAASQPSPGNGFDLLRRVDLQVDSISAFEQTFPASGIDLRRTSRGWTATVDGTNLSGTITVPESVEQPVRVQLKQLTLTELGTGPPYAGSQPQRLRPVHVAIKALRVGSSNLGQLTFSTQPSARGLELRKIELATSAFSLSGSGLWAFTEGRHRTSMDVNGSAQQLGDLLEAFGYRDSGVRGGATELHLTAQWDGVPSDFDLRIVTGALSARSTKGALLDVKPGLSGRAFGLLSLAAVPRALRLDFSHVFGEGFSYDKIEGNFHLEAGNAYTNDLTMTGPSADVTLAGRTGLVGRDYDQNVTVTPHVTSSLPLAPLWLAEKVFRTDIVNRVFSSRYTLTGSWDDPKIVRVVKESEPEVTN
ncbi:MAG: hypothetical protein ACI9W2_001670, partial [Gammaproteobacteria bacterium]